MKQVAPFGFVTGCHAGDKFMVSATLASIRHFAPNIPICLTVDGEFDVSDLEEGYGVIVLRISELPCSRMRNELARSFHAKQAAMWEGPFGYYVWLDSDAILWGDISHKIQLGMDFQILWNSISILPDAELNDIPKWLPHFYFDPIKLRRHDPDFDWRGHAYFSAGVYAARRDSIDFEHYCRIKHIADTEHGTFAWGDMGMLNYIVHSENQRGCLKVGLEDLQHIPHFNGRSELQADCAGNGWYFPLKIRRPRIAHFCGQKPYIHNWRAYCKPFTIARLEHYRKTRGELGAWLAVLNEEGKILQKRVEGKVKKILKS